MWWCVVWHRVIKRSMSKFDKWFLFRSSCSTWHPNDKSIYGLDLPCATLIMVSLDCHREHQMTFLMKASAKHNSVAKPRGHESTHCHTTFSFHSVYRLQFLDKHMYHPKNSYHIHPSDAWKPSRPDTSPVEATISAIHPSHDTPTVNLFTGNYSRLCV